MGDVIEVKESSRSSAAFKRLTAEDAPLVTVPTWLERDKNALKGTVSRMPAREDIDMPIEEHLIVELYSKTGSRPHQTHEPNQVQTRLRRIENEGGYCMIEIEKPQIECVETPGDASYGKYVIEPLERGYGTTLGNALRRILLSSLPGTAATSIKIAGVQHEFSTIPGVKEDVTEIVLNVKDLLTKLHCEGTKTVFIEAAGPCEVTAGDIKPDGEVEVLNPELHIATLDVGATLSMEITLSHGRGYVSADKNKAQRPGVIGVIPIDSIYTPVYKVNY
ncbi:MAG: hypothetical protein ACLTZE_09280, partial [Evtepia sp.]